MSKNAVTEVTIDANKYIIHRFGVDDGIEMALKLSDLILPIVGAVDQATGTVDTNEASELFVKGLASFGTKARVDILKQLLTVVHYKGKKGDQVPVLEIYDAHFLGNLGAIFKLAKEVIKHNGFLDHSQDIIQMFMPQV